MSVLLICACQDPTQITLEITTDVPCTGQLETSIAVGLLGEIETKPFSGSTNHCDPATGRIGSLVAVPSDELSAKVAFRIVTTIGAHPPECTGDKASDDCIISRRALGYLEHTNLLVPIVQRENCRGKPCEFDTTCVAGDCVSAQIDSALCSDAAGCGEEDLPNDGGGGAGGAATDPEVLVPDWAKSFGHPSEVDVGASVAVGANGTIYLAAVIASSGYDFSGGVSETSDLVIPTFNPAGEFLWAYSNISGTTTVAALAVDGAGNAYFAGMADAEGDYGGGLIGGKSDSDILVGSIDASGAYRWARAYGKDLAMQASHQATDVAVGPDGHVYVAGTVGDSDVTIEGSTVPAQSLWVASYQSDGTSRWVRAFAGFASDGRLSLDSSGNLYVAGTFSGTLELGELSSAGGTDAFVAKLDGDGTEVWAKRFGNANDDEEGIDVAVAVDGHVYLAGNMAAAVDFGGGPVDLVGTEPDAFVLALDGEGNHLWSRTLGVSEHDVAEAITTSDAGNVFVLNSMGSIVGFVTSLAADGSDRLQKPIMTQTGGFALNDLATGPQGEVIVTGAFREFIAFDDAQLTSSPSDFNGFLVRYAGE
jgi:hypothetical protein